MYSSSTYNGLEILKEMKEKIMPGYIIHLVEAKIVCDFIKKTVIQKKFSQGQDEFFYGSLLPDAGGKAQKQRSHFWNKEESNRIIMTPDINRFLDKYAVVMKRSPLHEGYLTHLHLDREFWNSYIKKQVEFLDINDEPTEHIQELKGVLIKKTGSVISPEKFFSKNYLYGDYTRLNKVLIQKYGLMIPVYNECHGNRIEESDNDNMQQVLEKLKRYIADSSRFGETELTVLSLDTLEVFLKQTAQQFIELYYTYFI